MRRLYAASLVLVMLLSGCGFALRGNADLPAYMQPTYLELNRFDSPLGNELRAALTAAGITLVPAPNPQIATLRIISERVDERVLTVGRSATVTEYELNYQLRYEVQLGERFPIPSRWLQVRRDYSFDETSVLGKEREAEQLQADMRRELVQLILTQISLAEPLVDGGSAPLDRTTPTAVTVDPANTTEAAGETAP